MRRKSRGEESGLDQDRTWGLGCGLGVFRLGYRLSCRSKESHVKGIAKQRCVDRGI